MTDNVWLWRQIERDLERRLKQEQRRDDDATDRFFSDTNNVKRISHAQATGSQSGSGGGVGKVTRENENDQIVKAREGFMEIILAACARYGVTADAVGQSFLGPIGSGGRRWIVSVDDVSRSQTFNRQSAAQIAMARPEDSTKSG